MFHLVDVLLENGAGGTEVDGQVAVFKLRLILDGNQLLDVQLVKNVLFEYLDLFNFSFVRADIKRRKRLTDLDLMLVAKSHGNGDNVSCVRSL